MLSCRKGGSFFLIRFDGMGGRLRGLTVHSAFVIAACMHSSVYVSGDLSQGSMLH